MPPTGAEDGRRAPDREEFEEQRVRFERRLLGEKRREALRIFIEALRATADSEGAVERNREGMSRIGAQPEEPEEPSDESSESESNERSESQESEQSE